VSGRATRLSRLEAAQVSKAARLSVGMTEVQRDVHWAKLKCSLEARAGKLLPDPLLSPEEEVAALSAFKVAARAYVQERSFQNAFSGHDKVT